jgi:uncharacterized protein (DUF1800 family)
MYRWWLLGLFVSLTGTTSALSYDDAVHLAERTGFGSPAGEIYGWSGLTREQAVDLILSHLGDSPVPAPPSWVNPPFERPPVKDAADYADAKKAFDQSKEAKKRELRSWFIQTAVSSAWPLNEKLALFWHNHFTSSLEKLDSGELLLQQDLMFRKLGVGDFGTFAKAVARDPAMLIYLDGESNVKGKPNENFARELLELFTLGEGNYTEDDIKEAARAFTGWTVDRAKGTAVFNPKRFDDGTKTVLGKTGAFNGDGVIEVILAQKQTAVFLTEKFWRFFVSDNPDPARIAVLADTYRKSHYQLKTLLRALFLEDAFWSPANRQALVRSPMELLIGQIRTSGLTAYDPARLTGQLARLGQDLFNPLSVKGWPVGMDWINAATLLERRRDLADLQNFVRKQVQSPQGNLE